MTTIYEVARGDFIKGLDGQLHEIDYVMARITQVEPLHYHQWYVATTDRKIFTMTDVRLYFKRAEVADAGSHNRRSAPRAANADS